MTTDPLPLLCCALALLLLGYFILSQFLPSWAALAIAGIKATIPLAYFWFYFQQSGWTLYDDVRYYDVAASLVQLGYRPWDLIIDPEGRDLLAGAAASRHTLYYLWNVVAQSVVGNYYFAAVFFNVGLTFVTGAVMFRTLRLLDFPIRFLQGLLVLHMLHWDYLSWTSLINVKETLVEALVIVSVCSMIRFVRCGSWASLLVVSASFLLLFSLRLYIPFLIMTGVGVWVLLQWQDSRKYLLLPIVGALLILFYAKIGDTEHQLYPHLIAMGAFRFLLTPQPWSITPGYSFLQIPMILQWLFFVPACIGTLQIWQRSRECRLLILVMLAFVTFYAMFPALQGPRHRVQLVAMFALMEFQCLLSVFQSLSQRAASARIATVPMQRAA